MRKNIFAYFQLSFLNTVIITLLITLILLFIYFISIKKNSYGESSLYSSNTESKYDSSKIDRLILAISENKNTIKDTEKSNAELIKSISARLDHMDKLLANPVQAEEVVLDEPEEEENVNGDLNDFIQKENESYQAEMIDFSWAPKAESDLEFGLSELASRLHFDLVNSECRTTRCNATVDFENYELAAKYGARLAEIPLRGLNCAKSIGMPIPGDTSARYQANLILDCSQQIEGKVQPIY